MRYNAVIYLIAVSIVTDEIGNQIEQETERKVFANEMTVSQNEFYNASAAGLRPSKMFEIYSFEYQGETKLKHDRVTYQIIRSEKRGEKMRIICEKMIG
jgi:SPP1 family predicted phage head-tail adaptor